MPQTLPSLPTDVHLHRLYAQYSRLPVGVVTQCAAHHATMVQAAFAELSGDWGRQVQQFYEQGEECLFDLLAGATTASERQQAREADGSWAWFLAAGADVLDFGGGLGLTAVRLANAGKRVTYVDVDGAIARFAAWNLARCGHRDVEVVTTRARIAAPPAGRAFDLVLAENVLEHVADPVAAVDALAGAVRRGGIMQLRIDPRPASATEPQRRELGVDALLAGAPRLGALEHLQRSDDGRHTFRAR